MNIKDRITNHINDFFFFLKLSRNFKYTSTAVLKIDVQSIIYYKELIKETRKNNL